jgi:hypothetical protein
VSASPPPPGPSGGAEGSAAIRPADARTYAGRVDALSRGVAEAHEALRRLGEEPLAVGTGQDNRAIAGWFRDLLVTDTAPAARRLADDLDRVGVAVREGATAWEWTDGHAAGSFRPDAGPG